MEYQCVRTQKFRKRINALAETFESKNLNKQIKLGFTDQPEPKRKDPLIYPGTDTRNDYTNWNVSTEIQTR